MILETHLWPVKGREHFLSILGFPSFVLCSDKTNNLDPLATRSMAPPIPLTSFQGMIQLAKSPVSETSIVPKKVANRCEPLTNPKASLEEE